MSQNIKVAVVEDSAQTRNWLKALLDEGPGFSCVSWHARAEEALAAIPRIQPDVVLVDLQLPRMNGVELIRKLRELQPQLPLLVFTNFDDHDLIFDSLKAGANGYLLKRTSTAELLESIQVVLQGGSSMTPSIARKVFNYFHDLPPTTVSGEKLSAREEEVLRSAKKGLSYKKIAAHLGISYDAVRTHFQNIYRKLHVHSRGEAVAKYFKL